MLDRYIEDEIMDLCERYGIGIVPFSPLAQGLLTGKYRKSEPIPQDSRATLKYNQVNFLCITKKVPRIKCLPWVLL